MTNRIDNLPQILDRMEICGTAKADILKKFGNSPKVTKANLRKAIAYKGPLWFLIFADYWLDMGKDLCHWISDQGENRLWARRYKHIPFAQREEMKNKIILEAVYAYYQEWRKP